MRHHYLALAVLLFLLTALAFAADNSAYVYVGSFTYHRGGVNNDYSITGFAVAADGSTQPIPGSPFTGPSFDLAAIRNYVFGDDGQQYIVTYTRAADGSLQATSMVDEYTYALGAPPEMEIYALNPDRSGQTFNSVLSCGSCDSYIIPWSIGADGQLSFLGGNAPPIPGIAKWGGVFTFSPDNHYAYTDTNGGFGSLQRNPNGTLNWISLWLPPQPPQNPGIEDSVCLPGDMAASVPTGHMAMIWWGSPYWCGELSEGYLVADYIVGTNGALTLLPRSAVTPQVSEYSMAFDPTGTYLAIAGTLGQYGRSGAIQIYKLQSNGTLTPVGDIIEPTGALAFYSVSWDNASHLYALTGCGGDNSESCGLYIFNFDGQNLTLAPGSPHAIINPISLAVAPAS